MIVVKTGDPVRLVPGDGTAAVVLPPESEMVLDQGTPVAYRQVAGDGGRLAEPRVFLPDGNGGWKQAGSPVSTAAYEAWLASAKPWLTHLPCLVYQPKPGRAAMRDSLRLRTNLTERSAFVVDGRAD